MPETVKKTTKPRKTATSKKSGNLEVMQHPPSYDQVAALAHQFWAERGGHDGHSEEDWFRAEQALRSKAS